jgi:hypothetical protein
VSVKVCVAVPAEFSAAKSNVYVPAGTAAVTVNRPFALLILTPDGAPVIEYTIVALPVAVT